ncbi:hypothetical protein GGS26DRAFT_539615 [Hypomontagnella submonticulosa]|nr:hypothetical protein GGS26DRAFT_539615 [Hypomontagnella submonticulosa]
MSNACPLSPAYRLLYWTLSTLPACIVHACGLLRSRRISEFLRTAKHAGTTLNSHIQVRRIQLPTPEVLSIC